MKFKAPTLGLKDVFFTLGTAKDAAKFENTVSKLARHVGTSPWPQSSLASKAMLEGKQGQVLLLGAIALPEGGRASTQEFYKVG